MVWNSNLEPRRHFERVQQKYWKICACTAPEQRHLGVTRLSANSAFLWRRRIITRTSRTSNRLHGNIRYKNQHNHVLHSQRVTYCALKRWMPARCGSGGTAMEHGRRERCGGRVGGAAPQTSQAGPKVQMKPKYGCEIVRGSVKAVFKAPCC